MNRKFLRVVATGLTVCLLLLGGLVYVQTVPHATHHAHHKAATHATALCTWMCAAGQGLETGHVVFHAQLDPITLLDISTSAGPRHISPITFPSRGPPFFFV